MTNTTKTLAPALGLAVLWLTNSPAQGQVQEAWVAQYDGLSIAGLSSTDWVADMEVRDGFVYVTGYESLFSAKWATVKYDYSGQELWARRVDAGQSQHAEALAVDAGGNVYVTGYQKQFSAGIDVLTIKYGPGGDVLWERSFSSPGGNNQPNDLALDASGNVYVAGASWVTAQQDFDVLLLKYDADGNLLWDRTLDNGDGQLDTAYDLTIDPSGNAIVAGFTEPNAYLAKYNPAGDLLWEHEQEGFSTNDEWRQVEADAAGNIYVLGEISPPGQPNHLWLNKYGPAGNILWERTYTGTYSGSCYVGGLAVMPDGGVVINGQSLDLPFNINIVTIRYASDGTVLWQRLENGGYAHASGDDVVVDAQGRIFVTGYGYDFSYQEDILTLGYTPDGELRWQEVYANPEPDGSDYPHTIAVDDAENVFVMASSWSFATSNDFTTIRYSPLELTVDVATLPIGAGGTAAFTLAAGSAYANQTYLLLGSASGTVPGLGVDGVLLPLNPDAYFTYTLTNPNGAFLANTLGNLDASGAATASLILPPGLSPTLIGSTLDHAYAVLDTQATPGAAEVSLASNAVSLTLVP